MPAIIFKCLPVRGSFLLPALSVGAVGGVMALASVAAHALNDLVERFRAKDLEQARAIQLPTIDANAAVTTRFGIPGLKAALDLMGMYGGPVGFLLFALDREKHQR